MLEVYQETPCRIHRTTGTTEEHTCSTVVKEDFMELVRQLRAACVALGYSSDCQ